MEQHPIPQHISSYQFRLIGNMNLRQFSMLAGGALVAILIFSLPIPAFFKWPGVVSFGFLGFALAFLPIEERPLDKWLVAFIKSIYAPTQYLWKKDRPLPEFLTYIRKKSLVVAQPTKTQADQKQMQEYIQTLPRKKIIGVPENEAQMIRNINRLFQTVTIPLSSDATPILERGKPSSAPTPSVEVSPFQELETPTAPMPSGNGDSQRPVPRPQTGAKTTPPPAFGQPLHGSKAYDSPLPTKRKSKNNTALKGVTLADLWPEVNKDLARKKARESSQLPFPALPTQANVVTGMIIDHLGAIIEGAIVEIRNDKGVPVRALKTNKLGQFRIVTPLDNGVFEIEVEKDPFEFDIIQIRLEGKIVSPIEIRAKRAEK